MTRSVALLCTCLMAGAAQAIDLQQAMQRRDADFSAGRPLVAHVVVALCDNVHQGIVPVPAMLGDGANPKTNLYWGAMYGVRGWFQRARQWKAITVSPSRDARVLERVLYRGEISRDGRRGEIYVLAEAWKGESIADAIRYFLEINRGEHVEKLRVADRELEIGGRAHLMAFIGHNGLMDFEPPMLPRSPVQASPHASVVLACISDSYFTPLLREHSAPLLMTPGLMAPEAYTLDAALTAWFAGQSGEDVRKSAAAAYARYQKTSERAASRLFKSPATAKLP
jgi:hypothetical protein